VTVIFLGRLASILIIYIRARLLHFPLTAGFVLCHHFDFHILVPTHCVLAMYIFRSWLQLFVIFFNTEFPSRFACFTYLNFIPGNGAVAGLAEV